ncbi:MAG: RNA methyltransferase [Spongiibacteraceae bacterium]|nr:RNA methyltransferase [Spongiibacteraceae bacterium]
MTPERVARLREALDKRQPDLAIITDYVHKGRNLSAIAHTADAVGIMDVHCVVGEKDYKNFHGTSMGSHSWVNVQRYTDIHEPVSLLRRQNFQVVATHLSSQGVDFHEIDYNQPTTLLLGPEKNGISDSAAQLADVCVAIPIVESFNVSVAAGIILTEVG